MGVIKKETCPFCSLEQMAHHLPRHISSKHSIESVCQGNSWKRLTDESNMVICDDIIPGRVSGAFCYGCMHGLISRNITSIRLALVISHICNPYKKRGVKLGPRTPPAEAPAPAPKSGNINKYLVDTFGELIGYESEDEDGIGDKPDDMPQKISDALKKAQTIEADTIKVMSVQSAKKDKIADKLREKLDEQDLLISNLRRDSEMQKQEFQYLLRSYESSQRDLGKALESITILRNSAGKSAILLSEDTIQLME